jgi:predicted nucleic acid-binding protein
MIILDTNVLSETLRRTPSTRVLEWMCSEPASALFTTAITESELLYGIALLPEGRRRQSLESGSRPDFRGGSGGSRVALRQRRRS